MSSEGELKRPGRATQRDALERVRAWFAMRAGVKEGLMFGLPAFFVDGRVLCCVCAEGVALRLSSVQAQSVVGAEACAPFKPFGRAPMPGWVFRAERDGHDLEQTWALLELAFATHKSRAGRGA